MDDAVEEGCLTVVPNACTEAPAIRHNDVECGFFLDIGSLALVVQYDGGM